MILIDLVANSVASFNVEVLSVERAAGGLLRITIDKDEGSVTADDCADISFHLKRVFEVEGVDYRMLEVGSPGVDRPLLKPKDFERFAGERVQLKLRVALDGRKVFKGTLLGAYSPELEECLDMPSESSAGADDPKFSVQLEEGKEDPLVLTFTIPELEYAKLDPVLNFKGKNK